jgi:hypothetical protein
MTLQNATIALQERTLPNLKKHHTTIALPNATLLHHTITGHHYKSQDPTSPLPYKTLQNIT